MSARRQPDPTADRAGAQRRSEEQSRAELIEHYDVALVRAPNPGPLSLSGTNTWVVGRGPAWVVDPGPLDDGHLQRISQEIAARGGLGGVVLTHDHHDHSEAVAALRDAHPAPLAGGRGAVDVQLDEGVRFGPFEAVATPGHAADHFALIADGACFTGGPCPGQMTLKSSRRRRRVSASR